jgi:hypothetical protein
MVRLRGSSSFTFIAASAIATALSPSLARAQDACVQALSPIALGSDVTGVTTADVDADGDRDVVFSRILSGTSTLWVYSNLGNGAFAGSQVHALQGGITGIEMADFDGDGALDALIAHHHPNRISVLLQRGGTFSVLGPFPAGQMPTEVAVGDIDGDGDIDAVATDTYLLEVNVLFNQGNGTFGAPIVYAAGPGVFDTGGTLARRAELVDLDNDGDLDLLGALNAFGATNGNASCITVRRNDGQGSFGAYEVTPTLTDHAWDLALSDFDADGALDLVVASPISNTTMIYFNSGTGTLIDPPTRIVAAQPYAIAGSDIDLDGDQDIVFTQWDGGMRVLTNDGSGTFAVSPVFDTPSGQGLAVDQLFGDARPEFVWPRDHANYGLQVYGNCQTEGAFRYCFGDAQSAVPCPCLNPGTPDHGCANLLYASGAQLAATGKSSVSADSLVLKATSMSGAHSWYFQATGQGLEPLGYGLLCQSGGLLRIGQKPLVSGSSTNPSGADPRLSVVGGIPPNGGTRYYQVSYRQANPICTPAPLTNINRTNGLAIVWTP